MDQVSASDVRAAKARLEGRVARTPLLSNLRLSDELGAHVLLKPENLQFTGSFKVRGVINALMARLESDQSVRGIATFSAGNHGAAAAFAARQRSLPCVVCMPENAVQSKVDAVRGYGGEVQFSTNLAEDCAAVSAERGYIQIHPFDDAAVIAGQGTVGLEILDDWPDAIDLVVVPVGGGGLISGVATAFRNSAQPGRPRIVGVEPQTANAVQFGLMSGHPQALPYRPTSLADGLTAPFAGERTLAIIQAHVDEMVTVDEEAILDAWVDMVDATKLFVEPSAAVGLAAIRSGQIRIEPRSVVVLVLSGGNVSPRRMSEVLAA